jgi:hypothetical protein
MKIVVLMLSAVLIFGCGDKKNEVNYKKSEKKAKRKGGRCSEGEDCSACTSCSSCKHCSKEGGTCSVCAK